jgi:hypothetical protein
MQDLTIKIPSELIAYINMFNLASDPSPESMITPLVMSHICQRWRAIAHSTSGLWSQISYCTDSAEIGESNNAVCLDRSPFSCSMKLLKHWFARSGDQTLDISLVIYDNRKGMKILNILLTTLQRWKKISIFVQLAQQEMRLPSYFHRYDEDYSSEEDSDYDPENEDSHQTSGLGNEGNEKESVHSFRSTDVGASEAEESDTDSSDLEFMYIEDPPLYPQPWLAPFLQNISVTCLSKSPPLHSLFLSIIEGSTRATSLHWRGIALFSRWASYQILHTLRLCDAPSASFSPYEILHVLSISPKLVWMELPIGGRCFDGHPLQHYHPEQELQHIQHRTLSHLTLECYPPITHLLDFPPFFDFVTLPQLEGLDILKARSIGRETKFSGSRIALNAHYAPSPLEICAYLTHTVHLRGWIRCFDILLWRHWKSWGSVGARLITERYS